MKRLHRKDLWCWSEFNERLNIDFNSFVWTRPSGGNVVIDPLPMTAHDRAHLEQLGGAAWIVLTNSGHVRGARALADATGAKIAGPAGERAKFPIACDAWIGEREPLFDWRVYEMEGSKTPGELALLLEHTLITGDLVRANRPASLMMLNRDQGLVDEAAARESISRLAVLPHLEAVLVGDGWCLFADCHESLRALVEPASVLGSH